MGLGAIPGSDPRFLGMPGMHGTYEANLAMHHCDVLLAVGVRFDERVISNPTHFASHSRKIIHIDIDPSSACLAPRKSQSISRCLNDTRARRQSRRICIQGDITQFTVGGAFRAQPMAMASITGLFYLPARSQAVSIRPISATAVRPAILPNVAPRSTEVPPTYFL